MSCEDFPACGHELGCCPDFDPETGQQLNMRCTCGAVVPLTSRSSICAGCLKSGLDDEEFFDDEDFDLDGDQESSEDYDSSDDFDGDYGEDSDIDTD